MNKIVFCIIIALQLMSCAANYDTLNEHYAKQIPADSLWRDQATTALRTYLSLIPPDELSNYGFDHKNELDSLIIGKPIPFTYLSDDGSLTEELHSIYVPIQNSNSMNYKAFMQFDKINNSWKNVGFGSSGLAKNIENIHQKDHRYLNSAILRITWLGSDYLPLETNQGIEMYHIQTQNKSVWKSFPKNPNSLTMD